MIHPLIWNAQAVDKDSDFPKRMDPDSLLLMEGPATILTQLILQKFPDLFTSIDALMQGPTDMCFGKAVAAQSRALKAQYSIELMQDTIAVHGTRGAEDYIYGILAGQIGAELAAEKARLRAEDKIMCPYQLAIPVRTMDASLFMPVIGFKTRYGIYDPNEVIPE